MGLFDGKAKQENAENEVLQKLSQTQILEAAVQQMVNETEASWIRKAQNYYDNCELTVIIHPDALIIEWRNKHAEFFIGTDGKLVKENIEDELVSKNYSYTASGYLPLHEYKYDNGKKEISVERVCYLWASIVRERMAAKMPECKFEGVLDRAVFTYKVPPLTLRDWF